MSTHTSPIRGARAAVLLVFVTAVAASSCSRATRLTSTWYDPAARPIVLGKTATVFLTDDTTSRRSAELCLAREFPKAVPSHTVIGMSHPDSGQGLLAKLFEAGYDNAIVMRVTSVAQVNYYPPNNYPLYTVETQIFSLSGGSLIFAARSETMDPENDEKLIDAVSKHVKGYLGRDGFMR